MYAEFRKQRHRRRQEKVMKCNFLLHVRYSKRTIPRRSQWRHTHYLQCSAWGGNHACQLVQNSNNPIKVNRFRRSGNIARLLRNTQAGEMIMMTCSRITASSEAKVKGPLRTKVHTFRCCFIFHALGNSYWYTLSGMFYERTAIELSSSLFRQPYDIRNVRIAENISQYKQSF